MRIPARLAMEGGNRAGRSPQYGRGAAISPSFYLIIHMEFVEGNPKNRGQTLVATLFFTSFCQNKNSL